VLAPGFAALADRHRSVGEVRGRGVFWALELVSDRATREPLAPYPGTSPVMAAVGAACRERGLLALVNVNRLHVVPPCTISETEAKEALAALDEVLGVADAHTR
jgi:taurine--2-oxoglutarate transaminase